MNQWPHAPMHRFIERGAYIVTAGTYRKQHFFRSAAKLAMLQDQVFALAAEYGWQLQAWALFSNHYHFVAVSPDRPESLRDFLGHLHSNAARELNKLDRAVGRKVWFQFWDTHLTFERSYLARLNYVHQNPVKHRLVKVGRAYPWCSANWFEEKAGRVFFRTVSSFKIDRVNVRDDWEVEWDPLACDNSPPWPRPQDADVSGAT